jgi:hypothetical protein
MAVALLLSVSSGLLMPSFVRMYRADPDFRADGLVAMNLSLPQSRYVQSDCKVVDQSARSKIVPAPDRF